MYAPTDLQCIDVITSKPFKKAIKSAMKEVGINSFKELAVLMGISQQKLNYHLNKSKGGIVWAIFQFIASK